MAAKRLHDGYEQDPDEHDEKRMRRLPSFSTVIREAMVMKQVQSLFIMLEPLFRRVVQEELQAGLVRSPRYIERSPETPTVERATWRLAFLNPPRLPIFTGSKIEDASGDALQVVVLDVETGRRVELAQPLRIELVPLFGDFPPEDREHWAAEEFQVGIVKERAGKRPLLTGDVGLTMRDGCATVGELQFTDNSSWVRCRKFRIGVRVVPGSGFDGARIREAMSEAFVVRDHRGELYKKHYPPLLDDDVWRLEKIGKDGAFHRKLSENQIKTVQEFLRMLTVQPEQLRAILGDGMTDRMWEVTTSHAKKCAAGDRVYAYSGQHGTIYVNSIFEVVKIEFAGMECSLQQLNKDQRTYVQQLYTEAYVQRNNLQEVDAAVNVMMHGHAANSVPLLQSAAQVTLEPPPVETPAIWYANSQDIEFQVDEVPQTSYQLQWNGGQMFNINMSG